MTELRVKGNENNEKAIGIGKWKQQKNWKQRTMGKGNENNERIIGKGN